MKDKALIFFVALVFLALWGMEPVMAQNRIGLGMDIGRQKLYGDAEITSFRPAPGLYFIYHFNQGFGLSFRTGYGEFLSSHRHRTHEIQMIPLQLAGNFYLSGRGFVPFFRFGVSLFNFWAKGSTERYFDGSFFGGGGFDWALSKQVSLRFVADYNFTTGDDFDGIARNGKDRFLLGRFGLTYYFPATEVKFEPQREERMLPAGEPVAKRERTPGQDIYLQVAKLKSIIDKLTELINQRDREIEELQALVELKDRKIEELDQKLAQLESGSSGGWAHKRQEPRNSEPERGSWNPPVQRLSDWNFRRKYEAALAKFNAYNYREALADFMYLLQANPDHPLAGNCQYWIGESYFGMGQYEKAVEAFEKVMDFHRSPKHDVALYMAARAYLRLGDKERARTRLQQLISQFPRSRFAPRAQRMLRRLQLGSVS